MRFIGVVVIVIAIVVGSTTWADKKIVDMTPGFALTMLAVQLKR